MKTALILILLAATATAAAALSISIAVPDCNAVIEPDTTGELIRADGYATLASPGDPALPYKEISLLLPPNADPHSVIVGLRDAATTEIEGLHELAPAPPIATSVDGGETVDWGPGKEIANGRNAAVYSRNEFYPSSNVQVVSVGNMRKWRLARVRYYPYRCNPVSRQVTLTTGGEIELSYDLRSVTIESVSGAARDRVFTDKVADIAANFEEARSWYDSTGGVMLQSEPAAAGGYAILTTSAIASASTKLAAFVNHKTSRGFGVTVVTEAQWGGGTGDTAANRIRAWLKANYVSKGLKYVLLIGNPSPSTGDVPMKMLWPRLGSSTYREAPSDHFYADLTGNWDLNGDGYYGDSSYDLGTGGCDLYPEVIVGRIPYYSVPSDLDSILQKIMDYESGVTGGDWVKRALMSAKPSDGSTPGYHLFEAIKSDTLNPAGFGAIRVYEETYGVSPAPDYTPCSYANVTSAWNQHAGFHFWWTHGNETVAADIFSSDRTAQLSNSFPSFTFQCSCLNATPENSNNLAYALLKRGAIATNAATRVSWYYPGQTIFTDSDSNAGMTYKYAYELIRNKRPCGDAHYAMQSELPRDIWMNHCVFNLFGDPSLVYASGPAIIHPTLPDTDVTSSPYQVEAQVTTNGPLKTGSPVVKWNTNGGPTFNTASMSLVGGLTYRAQIPAQPYGTTVYYYLHAEDTAGRTGVSPAGAPGVLHSFRVRVDTQPPVIQHTPLANTGNLVGPYIVQATITDDTAIGSAVLYYHRNSAADTAVAMTPVSDNTYQGQIPGPSAAGDVISYYIGATDASLSRNTARSPSLSGYYSFAIPPKRRVAVYNSSSTPLYFSGTNSNCYQSVANILSSDPSQRFDVSVVTSLTATDLAGKDALILPDNGVLSADTQSVINWFGVGKTIVTLESSTSYAACSGFMWPAAAGTSGYGNCWDTNASVNDQQIMLADPITAGYSVGDVIESRGYTASFIASALPSDARILSRSKNNPARVYAAYRDVPGKGRIVALGPYVQVLPTQYSMIREALAVSPTDKTVTVTAPAPGVLFETGQTATISYMTSGVWSPVEKVKLEYNTGLDSTWLPIPGAGSLGSGNVSFNWLTAGLPSSDGYRVRASQVAGGASDRSDAPFTIVGVVTIAQAKALPDASLVKLKNKPVLSAVSGQSYIGEYTRLTGIKVRNATGLVVGALATVVGKMSTENGERAVDAISNLTAGGASAQVGPLFMRMCALGGGSIAGQEGVVEYRRIRNDDAWSTVLVPATGINTIGVLARVAGKVTAIGSDYLYVDDGTGCDDGSGFVGVRILCGTMAKPSVNARVAVTGVSSTYFERGCLWRAIVLPTQSSWQLQ